MTPEEKTAALEEHLEEPPPEGMGFVCAVCGDRLPQKRVEAGCVLLACPGCFDDLPPETRREWNRAVMLVDYGLAARIWRGVSA